MNNLIEARELSKTYGTVQAVDGVSLSIRAGEVFGLLGPNGAGKSTLIEMLLGFTPPTSGTVQLFGGEDPQSSNRVFENAGAVPERCSVYSDMTAREHIELAAEAGSINTDVAGILSEVSIDPSDRDRPAAQYSKGMRQRVLLGMALVGEPELLILDEPSSGLDPAGAAELREIVRRRASNGVAVVFSSHNLRQVEAVCERVGILRDGELVATDTIEGLRGRAGGTERIEAVLTSRVETTLVDELTSIDGVTAVERDDQQLGVVVSRPEAKAPVVATMANQQQVIDFSVSETSLEELFTVYTDADSAESSHEALVEGSA